MFFFFHDTATTEIYTLSLHDALPISFDVRGGLVMRQIHHWAALIFVSAMVVHLLRVFFTGAFRSEEHTSELQSRLHLVCRLLLEKKNHRPRSPGDPPIRERRRLPCMR